MLRYIQLLWSNKITSTYFRGSVTDFPRSLSLPPTWATKVCNVKLQFPFVPHAACNSFWGTGTGQALGNGGGWVTSSPDATVEERCGCRHVSKNKWVTYISLSEVRGESTLQPAARKAGQTQGCRSRDTCRYRNVITGHRTGWFDQRLILYRS